MCGSCFFMLRVSFHAKKNPQMNLFRLSPDIPLWLFMFFFRSVKAPSILLFVLDIPAHVASATDERHVEHTACLCIQTEHYTPVVPPICRRPSGHVHHRSGAADSTLLIHLASDA